MNRIGVWNTAFLGDAVLTLPLIRLLHAAWPHAAIDFYVRGGFQKLFTAQPELNQVYDYDKRGTARGVTGFRLLANEVAARHYDLWIDAHLSLRSSLMARMSRAPRRIGYAEANMAWWLLTDTVGRKFEARPEIERLVALLEPLQLPQAILADENLCWPELVLPLSAQAEASNLLGCLPPGPLLGVHPGSVWPTKRWTPEGFAHIVRRGLEAGANVVLLASPDEVDTAAAVRSKAGLGGTDRGIALSVQGQKGSFLDLSGKTTLPGLAAVISRLQCYVTNDSGPMHLAWSQRVPVTALFGPTTESLGFFPRGQSRVFQREEACRPCGLHGHRECPQGHFNCMRRINPEEVWEDVEAKLFPWKQGAASRAALLPGI